MMKWVLMFVLSTGCASAPHQPTRSQIDCYTAADKHSDTITHRYGDANNRRDSDKYSY